MNAEAQRRGELFISALNMNAEAWRTIYFCPKYERRGAETRRTIISALNMNAEAQRRGELLFLP